MTKQKFNLAQVEECAKKDSRLLFSCGWENLIKEMLQIIREFPCKECKGINGNQIKDKKIDDFRWNVIECPRCKGSGKEYE